MNVTFEIGYEQLLKLIRQLTPKQRRQLAKELQQKATSEDPHPGPTNLQQLLLTGPVLTEEEVQAVLKTRIHLDQLRQQHGAR